MTSCVALAAASGPAWAAAALACSVSALKPAFLMAVSRSYSALRACAACSCWVAAWSAWALAIRAWLATAAANGAAMLLMYPVASSISWIWSESTTMPSFSISPWLPSLTSWERRSRSRMISSTVRLPMIERRWPAKIRPTSSSMLFCSDRNRRAALAIEAGSSPILKAAMARTCSRIPWVVMQSSAISASCSESERKRAFCFMGRTKQPCPVTIRNWVSCSLRREPEMSRASLGAGTCQNSI